MTRTSHSSDSHDELATKAHATWRVFTRYTVKACIAVAVVLLLMLIVFKVL